MERAKGAVLIIDGDDALFSVGFEGGLLEDVVEVLRGGYLEEFEFGVGGVLCYERNGSDTEDAVGYGAMELEIDDAARKRSRLSILRLNMPRAHSILSTETS